jgi:hypothetical protein
MSVLRIYMCVVHDDILLRGGFHCVHGCESCCDLSFFCDLAWAQKWVVNFSVTSPAWHSWEQIHHRAEHRGVLLPLRSLKFTLDVIHETTNELVGALPTKLPCDILQCIGYNVRILLVNEYLETW